MRILSASQLLLPKTYEDVWYRGEAYVERDLVKVAKSDKQEIRALVRGGEEYVVSLQFSGGGLLKKCNCPYAAGTGVRSPACKHMVAAAIVWDGKRHLERPSREEIETDTIPPPLVSRFDLERAHQNPISANLEILRLSSSDGSSRPHSRLPLMPEMEGNPEKPLTLLEAKKLFRTLIRWTRLSGYDKYFCAGEMVAAFCEVLRVFKKRLPKTDPLLGGDILREAQKFHYKLILELVDDSDGLHTFSEAHLDAIAETLKNRKVSKEDRAFLDQKIWDFEVHRDDY